MPTRLLFGGVARVMSRGLQLHSSWAQLMRCNPLIDNLSIGAPSSDLADPGIPTTGNLCLMSQLVDRMEVRFASPLLRKQTVSNRPFASSALNQQLWRNLCGADRRSSEIAQQRRASPYNEALLSSAVVTKGSPISFPGRRKAIAASTLGLFGLESSHCKTALWIGMAEGELFASSAWLQRTAGSNRLTRCRDASHLEMQPFRQCAAIRPLAPNTQREEIRLGWSQLDR